MHVGRGREGRGGEEGREKGAIKDQCRREREGPSVRLKDEGERKEKGRVQAMASAAEGGRGATE